MTEAKLLLNSQKSRFNLLVDHLNEFKSEDEDSDQYWYLLGLKLAELNIEQYQYTKRVSCFETVSTVEGILGDCWNKET